MGTNLKTSKTLTWYTLSWTFLQNTESIAKNGNNKSCLTDCICLAKAVDRITGTGRAQPAASMLPMVWNVELAGDNAALPLNS